MPHVLITGASDGIGRALVNVYAEQGWAITATGRRPREALENPMTCPYVPCDLTEDMAPVLDALPPRLDLAILNAGLGKVGPPEAHSAEDIAQMIALNVTAPLLLAQKLMPRMEGGAMAFIGSTAARGAHRDFSVYAATKAALAGATRSLALEWQGRVQVLTLHPGPTATGMHDKAGLGNLAARRLFTAPDIVAETLAGAIARGKNRRLGPGYMLRHALRGARR
ncbi:MAG: SDR family NAD(P)-dependent oxidoreductase [Pseudomonadota bacterium]